MQLKHPCANTIGMHPTATQGTGVRYHLPAAINGLELLSCSDVAYRFAPHFHDAYCIWLNTASAESYTHKGCSGILPPGSFGIFAPGEVHSNQAFDSSSRQLLSFYLNAATVQQIAGELTDHSSIPPELATGLHADRDTYQALVNLWLTLTSSPSALHRQSLFRTTLALLLSRYATAALPTDKIGEEPRRVAKIIELFHDRLEEDLQLDELAAWVDCTPSYLIRCFKKASGLTPHAYLLQLRLEQSRRLLQQGQSIVQASLLSGFSDQSHLSRHFKRKFGLTPGAYRQQVKKT